MPSACAVTLHESYKRFLGECAAAFDHVFIISGNHEYYGHDIRTVDEHIPSLSKSFDNVTYLNCTGVDITGTDLRIIGTTLWSEIKEDQMSDIRYSLSDFQCIRKWSIEENQMKHKQCLNFIKQELKNPGRLIVMTHHPPVLKCGHPKHTGSSMSSAFKNDLGHLILQNTDKIAAWMYGHDHYSMQFKLGNTTIMSNQIGYPGENPDQGPSACVIEM